MQNVPISDIPTIEFGPPKDWPADVPCDTLTVGLIDMDEGPFMVTAWRPSPEELKAINDGKAIFLYIRGRSHPVIAFGIETDAKPEA